MPFSVTGPPTSRPDLIFAEPITALVELRFAIVPVPETPIVEKLLTPKVFEEPVDTIPPLTVNLCPKVAAPFASKVP